MIAYLISFLMLILAIWHDRRRDLPDLDTALDSLPVFDFDKNWWVSYDNSSALAIDSKKHKICLLRAYKGLQVIDYRQLLEFDFEEKTAKPPSSGVQYFFNSFVSQKPDYSKLVITLLLDDLSLFDFTLKLYYGKSAKEIKKNKLVAKQIINILKIVQKRAEKLEKSKGPGSHNEYDYYDEDEELLEVENSSGIQGEFNFEPA